MSAGLALALLAISAVAPMPVFADNGSSLGDLWAALDQAAFAGMATPILIWAANKARLPPPPGPPPNWTEPKPRPLDYRPPPRNPEGPEVDALRRQLLGQDPSPPVPPPTGADPGPPGPPELSDSSDDDLDELEVQR